jgi:hypothetical protein
MGLRTALRTSSSRPRPIGVNSSGISSIEAITALEIAVDEAIRERLAGDKRLAAAIQSYWGLALKPRLTVVSACAGVTPDDVMLALDAYEMRNGIGHEGRTPSAGAGAALDAVYRVVAALTTGPRLHFPPQPVGNELRPSVDDWLAHPGPGLSVGEFSITQQLMPGRSSGDRSEPPPAT